MFGRNNRRGNNNMLHSPEVIELLETAPLFSGIPNELLFENLGQSRLRILHSGEVLFVPGQTNNVIYIVLAGRLNVQVKLSHVEPFTILGEGECVGELSVLGGAPVSAYVIAATDCRLLAISNTALWDLINNSHKAAHNMLNILTKRIRHTNQVMAQSMERDHGFSGGAMVDELTGLYNQHWMQQKLNRLLHRSGVDKRISCLMLLEIDQLKEFTAKYGQLGSDQALRDIAHTMQSCLRPEDLAGRHFGERFVVFLPNTSILNACIAAERLRAVVNESIVVLPSGDALPSISISVGVSQVYSDDTLVRILARTDKALMLAKECGGNSVKLVE